MSAGQVGSSITCARPFRRRERQLPTQSPIQAASSTTTLASALPLPRVISLSLIRLCVIARPHSPAAPD